MTIREIINAGEDLCKMIFDFSIQDPFSRGDSHRINAFSCSISSAINSIAAIAADSLISDGSSPNSEEFEEFTEETTISDEFDTTPMYLLQRDGDHYCNVFRYDPDLDRHFYCWSGLYSDLNKTEYPIFGFIDKEDLRL